MTGRRLLTVAAITAAAALIVLALATETDSKPLLVMVALALGVGLPILQTVNAHKSAESSPRVDGEP